MVDEPTLLPATLQKPVATPPEYEAPLDLAAFDPHELSDPIEAAAAFLAAKLDALSDPQSERQRRSRARIASAAVLLQAARHARKKGNEITVFERDAFLLALASGLQVKEAAMLVPSVHPKSWWALRRRDAEFAEEWDDALEMRSEPVLGRLTEIALYGDERLPATVKAAEAVMRNTSRRERPDIRYNKLGHNASSNMVIKVETKVVLPD